MCVCRVKKGPYPVPDSWPLSPRRIGWSQPTKNPMSVTSIFVDNRNINSLIVTFGVILNLRVNIPPMNEPMAAAVIPLSAEIGTMFIKW